MTQTTEGLAARLQDRFGSDGAECRIHVGQVTMEIHSAALPSVARALVEEPGLEFGQLVDLCGVDYLDYGRSDWETSDSATDSGFSRGVERGAHGASPGPRPTRFAVVYHLLSHALNQRLRLRCWAEGEPPRIPSVVGLWPSANWFEREAFDLFGILFEDHPDLRRILTDYGFIGHPFRKDFPLSGEVEMRFDPEKRRVVYEPVSIEPRTLVPRVIRHDTRYTEEGDGVDA